MPTLVFLTLAYQIETHKWRYLFLILAALNLIFNLYHQAWLLELYSATTIALLFMLNPYFFNWWQKRNERNNPDSFKQFALATFMIAKYNKFQLFYWVTLLVVSIVAVCFYAGYTGYALLAWLLAIFLTLYIARHLFYSILPPEWFLHDINTGYVFLSVFLSWGAAYLIILEVGTNFIKPMILAVVFCSIGFHLIRHNTRYLMPGCAVILADIVWQIIRYVQDDMGYTAPVITTGLVLISAMLIGLIWLVKKPGILPVAYLSLFQLFRFSGFTFQAVDRITSSQLSSAEVTYYLLYLVCWMYIVPLLFWLIGLSQRQLYVEENVEKHTPRSNKKFFDSFKKNQPGAGA
jgi:hypothetical protein